MKNFKIAILLILLITCNLFGQESYFIPNNANIPVAATGISSMDVESLDVDDDGDLDLIIAGEYSRNLLLFNDGNGVFVEDPNRLFPEKNTTDGFSGEDSEDIAFADFNQDGNMDLLFVSEDSIYHELLINDGNGNFTFITYDFPSTNGNAVAVLDLNNDDYPDIIIGNTGQNHVYINNQDLTFTQDNSRWPTNTEGTQDLKSIDLDNDGDMDLVEGIDQGSNNILINTNGFFTEENNRLPDTGLTLETRKITLGDVNGDTYPDIFVSTVNFIGNAHLQSRLYLNDGNGFFTDATTTHLPIYLEHTLDALFIDYDFDDDLDLITTDLQNPGFNYHSFENDGNGVFTETTDVVFESFTYNQGVGLHTADFDNDTYPDLYFSNYQETDDILFFSEAALGLDENTLKNGLHIYPNPTSEKVQLNLPNGIIIKSIQLYNVLGVRIKNFETSQTELSLKEFSSGIYIFKVITDSGSFTKKIVKK